MIDSQIELMRIIKRNKKMVEKSLSNAKSGKISKQALEQFKKRTNIQIPFILVKYDKSNLFSAYENQPAGLQIKQSYVKVESTEPIDFYGEASVLKELQVVAPTETEIGNLFKHNMNLLNLMKKTMNNANEFDKKFKTKYGMNSTQSITLTESISDIPISEHYTSSYH